MSASGQSRRFNFLSITSGLPQRADISGRGRYFAFVPQTDIEGSLDQLVSDLLNVQRHFEAERRGSLEIDQ